MPLTPEQQKALLEAMSPSIKVSSTLGIPLDEVETFQQNIRSFIYDNHAHYAGQLLCFVLSPQTPNTSPLAEKEASKAVLQGKGLLRVDKDLRLISADKSPGSMTSFTQLLLQEHKFGIFVTGSYIWELLCGFPIDEYDAISGLKNLPFDSDISARPMASFNLILDDHKRHRIDNQKGIEYWSNKNKRVLRTEGGTEWIFQKDLYWWLKHYVSGALDVIAEPSGNGQDKHDIRVITENGKYVIEIKWLGTNGTTTYGQDKINVGLVQVGVYLSRDNSLLCGHLVVYDGRSQNDHASKSSHDESFRHELCEKPIVIFLESETPSKKAERIVKETKIDPANK